MLVTVSFPFCRQTTSLLHRLTAGAGLTPACGGSHARGGSHRRGSTPPLPSTCLSFLYRKQRLYHYTETQCVRIEKEGVSYECMADGYSRGKAQSYLYYTHQPHATVASSCLSISRVRFRKACSDGESHLSLCHSICVTIPSEKRAAAGLEPDCFQGRATS